MQAEELLREGRLDESLEAVQAEVRKNPADPKLRVFLFQLLAVMGRWDKAITQLNVAGDIDARYVLVAQACRPLLNCEALRAEVFAGKRAPLVFGEPGEWMGRLVQSLELLAQGQVNAALELRQSAFELATPRSGQIDGAAFEWIADADGRLGPVVEAVVEGRYYWVPFESIQELTIDEPSDLRDLVWAPAQFVWTNGGNVVAFIPTRYPGSEMADDDAIRLARKTDWIGDADGACLGLGQRMFATDEGEYPLLETRRITFFRGDGPSAEEGEGVDG